MADCKVYKQAISCQPVTEKPCLCEAGIMFSAVCSCVSQSVCLSVQKKMKSCWIRNVMVYKNICYGLSCTIWWLHLGDIWHWPDCKSCFSISVFFGPTPHPLCERYRLITQQTLWRPFHYPGLSNRGVVGSVLDARSEPVSYTHLTLPTILRV